MKGFGTHKQVVGFGLFMRIFSSKLKMFSRNTMTQFYFDLRVVATNRHKAASRFPQISERMDYKLRGLFEHQ